MIQYKNNELHVENSPLRDIAQGKPTPFYLYSYEQIKRNLSKVEDTFKGMDYHISFATKSNNNLFLLEELKKMGVGIDIVSKGELEAAKLVNFHNNEVIVNGNGKTRGFLSEVVDFNPRALNVDSQEEIDRLEKIALEKDKEITVALRINPDVDPVTHPYISTGLKKNKFGIDLDSAKQIIKKYLNHQYIKIKGLHVHIGSQLLSISPYEDAYEKCYEFIESLDDHQLEFINVGGGWGIDYEKNGVDFPLDEYKERVIPILKKINLHVILELGRFLIGNAGVLVGNVEYVKESPYKKFVVTDASMASLIRPSLYNGYHHIFTQYNSEHEESVDVVGPLCETGDRLAEERMINLPQNGDLLVICDAGAYGYSMCSNYNFSFKPAEYLLKNNEIKLIRPQEELKQLVDYYQKDGVS
ncbi:diaminopimelate decarboxylase [Serpentinicella sp. ANB-PHB4]|uniref:diaminopimelate decarboxylase n=1 Tax=Serpentinicella sp. ANB-PHB4 TaxID=3074076 RepID=UPI0028544545|nr:diaminopimelate decarboxylase [Serpentinicella sp. ANB-PHB4]MDR5658340.1 diaminopimelate decarboxylase [Serpentinicella sp. ANB-PHB4]